MRSMARAIVKAEEKYGINAFQTYHPTAVGLSLPFAEIAFLAKTTLDAADVASEPSGSESSGILPG